MSGVSSPLGASKPDVWGGVPSSSPMLDDLASEPLSTESAPSLSGDFTTAPESGSEPTKKRLYLQTIKECFTKPDETVLKYPIKSAIYHIAIQILFYSVAQTFPILGWTVMAFSAALFERVVILNPKEYGNAILDSLKDSWRYISSKWKKDKSDSEQAETTEPLSTSSLTPAESSGSESEAKPPASPVSDID